VRYLGLALFAEGSTDHRFLSPVVRRASEEICRQRAVESVEIGEVCELHSPPDVQGLGRDLRILEAARRAAEAFDILFVHADGAADPGAAWASRIEPAIRRMTTDATCRDRQTVAVVPVKETEAWALVDGDALRGAFGTVVDDQDLGIPVRPREVERVLDPKQTLARAYANVVGGDRRKRRTSVDFLEAIGVRILLARIREVPAFQRFELELCTALRHLGYITPEA
jgi:hypothetical protein